MMVQCLLTCRRPIEKILIIIFLKKEVCIALHTTLIHIYLLTKKSLAQNCRNSAQRNAPLSAPVIGVKTEFWNCTT